MGKFWLNEKYQDTNLFGTAWLQICLTPPDFESFALLFKYFHQIVIS